LKDFKFIFILLFMLVLSVSAVSASDLNETAGISCDSNQHNQLTQITNNSHYAAGQSSIYVDDINGDDENDGKSWDSSIKTFNKALEMANDDDTICLADGVYSGLDNTKLNIDKSVNVVGSLNTTFDASYENYLFLINDGVTVTFKNINFINAYKTDYDIDLIDNYEIEGIYGAALDIKNATVTLDNCYFKDNMANYADDEYQYAYGGAVSNFGDLTILNSYFYGNAIGATTDIFGYGGALYNKGKLFVNNSSFINSRGSTYSFGGAIYNDGELLMNNSVIADSYCWEESKGGAIFNNGIFTLLNSIVENNTIERTDYNYIYGTVFNSGTLTATGNIFRNNTGYYKQPNSEYEGTGTIYNVGNLDLSYNVFIDNIGFNRVVSDVYLNGGENINLDNNWWGTNENPFGLNKISQDKANSWIIFDLNPNYSSLNVNDNVDIFASWKLSNGAEIKNNLPVFGVTVYTIVDGKNISFNYLTNETIKFNFNNTKTTGTYDVIAIINSFTSRSIIDVGKSNAHINFNVNNVTFYNETVLLDIFLLDEENNPITGNVTVKLNNNINTVEVKQGKGNITFNNLVPGNYTLNLIYDGTSLYSKANNETEIYVKKIPVQLEISEVGDIKTSDIVNLNVTLTGNVEGVAYLYINGVFKQRIYLNNGISSFNLNNFEEGQYNITIIFPEDSIHESANSSVFFNVGKSSVSFNVSCEDIYSGNDAIIRIEVTPENFNSEVIVSINGINNTVVLTERINNITVSGLTNGTYDVKVIFNGNDRFFKANASTSFNVFKSKSSLNVTIEKNNLTGIISVKVIPNKCSGLITLFVNQRQYKSNLINGRANFNVEFDKGTNHIYVDYSGNLFYDGSSWNTSIGEPEEIFIIAQNVTSYEYNDFNYTVILFEENGFGVVNKNVTVEFLGKTYNITTDNQGKATLKLNLKAGTYDIKAKFENKTVSNSIKIKEISFNLIAQNITYGGNEIVKVIFEDNITGKIKFKLSNGLEMILDIAGNETFANISDLNAGSYIIEAVYFNDLINSSTFKSNFIVYKANAALDVNISGAELGKDCIISVKVPETMSGELNFNLDGKNYSKQIESSVVSINLGKLDEGSHNLSISYLGDNNFNKSNYNTTFSIKSFKTDIILTINNTRYDEELKIIAKLNENVSGIVEFIVGNLTGSSEIKNGEAIWTFGGLDVGQYVIEAKYLGDDSFLPISNQTSFIISKADSFIQLYVNEVCLDENIRIYAKLSPNSTGTVTYEMPGHYSPRTKNIVNSTSNWYISPLVYGKYTVYAKYNGDKNYNPSNTTFILDVSQRKSILDVVIEDVYMNNRVVVNVKLTSDKGSGISGNVLLNIASRSYNIKVNNGKGSLVLGKFAIGSYSYEAVFEGNDEYVKSTDDGKFNVLDSLVKTELLSTNVTKRVGGKEKLVISLVNAKGNPLSGYAINIKLNNNDYSLLSNENGDVSLDINLKAGLYNAIARFNGSDNYHASEINITINVLSTIQSSDVVKLYGTGTQYFAIFTDCNGKALNEIPVTFTIGSKSYTFNTAPNGVARLNINLKPGIYTIIAKNPVSGEEARNTINVYAYIMQNKDVVKYFGGSQSYKVRVYDDSGKSVGAGQTVVFKINGKTYNIKTDKLGYATCKLDLKPNTYTITASHKGYTVYNKVVVKPVLTGKIVAKKKSKSIKFKAKLLNTKGKPLKGKKITFKIKSKTYKVKTNKKGVAKLKLKLKLKSGKKYKVVFKYGKSKVKNIINVK